MLMKEVAFYGDGLPYASIEDLPGKLIVLEGTDGVGRSTHIQLLRKWLEEEGFGVSDTGLTRSPMTQPGLDAAKAGNTLGHLTMSLFYATDFADRLENQIVPALKAGFYVLSDRYFYSVIARDVVRGADPQWARKLYGFALKPDIVFYLRADLPTLVARIVHGRGFDYWESGMDIRCADNLHDSFCSYQTLLIQQFDQMADEFGFITIDATRSVEQVFQDLRTHIQTLEGKSLAEDL
jgi:dTMP kinase